MITRLAAVVSVITGPVNVTLAGGARFESPYRGPWRYTIDAVGGVGSLTVDAAT